MNDEINMFNYYTDFTSRMVRAYHLKHGDQFSVDIETFIKQTTLWMRNKYQIVGFEKATQYKHFLWMKIPWGKKILVKLEYLGE